MHALNDHTPEYSKILQRKINLKHCQECVTLLTWLITRPLSNKYEIK